MANVKIVGRRKGGEQQKHQGQEAQERGAAILTK